MLSRATLLCLVLTSSAHADPAALRVAVAGDAPFVLLEAEHVGGAAVLVWEEVARRLDLRSDYRVYDTADEAIDAVASGEVDVAVGPLSITRERAHRVAFTQPWMQSGVGIVTEPTLGLWAFFRQLMSRAFLYGVSVLLFVLTGIGGLLYLAERKDNPAFQTHPVAGIGHGMWLALVTMTTVGYGDLAPVTRLGRVITGVWMILAMFTASSLTAGIATALTLSQLATASVQTPSDFPSHTIGVIRGTSTVPFVHRFGGHAVQFANLDDAFDALRGGSVDAVAHDRPVLLYTLHSEHATDLVLSESSWELQGYGFAFPPGEPQLHDVNVELLGLRENREIDRILDRWF